MKIVWTELLTDAAITAAFGGLYLLFHDVIGWSVGLSVVLTVAWFLSKLPLKTA